METGTDTSSVDQEEQLDEVIQVRVENEHIESEPLVHSPHSYTVGTKNSLLSNLPFNLHSEVVSIEIKTTTLLLPR